MRGFWRRAQIASRCVLPPSRRRSVPGLDPSSSIAEPSQMEPDCISKLGRTDPDCISKPATRPAAPAGRSAEAAQSGYSDGPASSGVRIDSAATGGCQGCPSLRERRAGSGTQSMRMMLGCILDGAPSDTLAVWSIVHTNDGSTLCAATRALTRLCPSGAASASASTLPLTPGSPRPWA